MDHQGAYYDLDDALLEWCDVVVEEVVSPGFVMRMHRALLLQAGNEFAVLDQA